MKLLILVVDDEPDVEMLFRQQFRHDLRSDRFTMEFARSGEAALQRIDDAAGVSIILILSDINMPGMTGLELLPKAKAARPDVPVIMITAYGDADFSPNPVCYWHKADNAAALAFVRYWAKAYYGGF